MYNKAAYALLSLPALFHPSSALTGTFDVVTYNVAGLPAFLGGDQSSEEKQQNANAIGQLLAENDYDVVHLQEDFNYHAYIYETNDHTYRTPTSGGVPFGDGLNTLANYDWSDFSRTEWDECNLNEADCLTPKGFSFLRMQLANGVEVDLYNLHADAGSEEGDVEARAAGVEQLLTAIEENSSGRAVVVAGDTNDRYTNEGRSITELLDAGFADAWVELIQGGEVPQAGAEANACNVPASSNECEIVDKILYRSGHTVALAADAYDQLGEQYVRYDGQPLSDHNRVLVDFTWSTG